jgi:hypothetical protein
VTFLPRKNAEGGPGRRAPPETSFKSRVGRTLRITFSLCLAQHSRTKETVVEQSIQEPHQRAVL